MRLPDNKAPNFVFPNGNNAQPVLSICRDGGCSGSQAGHDIVSDPIQGPGKAAGLW
ncbi:hypothetical protein T10_8216 [Trichinella papuae]|uniref:Uncharacterized protein n=1 Tax=Trichinella papuae TaxID=268474 RepID=A0A0V1M263_9BILA|nr:hypothetical protein T10_8216 [Trichinella papuae]